MPRAALPLRPVDNCGAGRVYIVYMTTPLDRERILSEAGELFVAHGPQGVTMRGLATRIGVTPMALYRYFENREQVLRGVIEDGHSIFLSYLQQANAQPTPAGRLFEAGRQYLAFALAHPRRYAVMFMEHIPNAPEHAECEHWIDAATFRFLVDRIRDCNEDGSLVAGDPKEAAFLVWGQVHGLVSLYLAGKLSMNQAEFEALYLRSMGAIVRALGWRGPGGAAV